MNNNNNKNNGFLKKKKGLQMYKFKESMIYRSFSG